MYIVYIYEDIHFSSIKLYKYDFKFVTLYLRQSLSVVILYYVYIQYMS